MRKKVLLALGLAFITQLAFAQTSSLKGSVVDNTDNKNLQNTVISLMRARDSVLVRFVRADRAGNFSISNLKEGEYIIMITIPTWAIILIKQKSNLMWSMTLVR